MKFPAQIDTIRETRVWQRLRDWRYLRRHRARRDFYRQFVPPGALVFDIGANVGHYALLFLSLRARVVAIEPQAELVTGLRRRLGHRDGFTLVHTALGAMPGTATLHKAPGQSEIASLREDIGERSRFGPLFEKGEIEAVNLTTLDALITAHGMPDFCKIDVEGFEAEVLAGLSRPLPQLSIEMNREYWDVAQRCLARLTTLGNYQFNYALGESCALASPQWLSPAELETAIRANQDPLLWGDIYARLVD